MTITPIHGFLFVSLFLEPTHLMHFVVYAETGLTFPDAQMDPKRETHPVTEYKDLVLVSLSQCVLWNQYICLKKSLMLQQ